MSSHQDVIAQLIGVLRFNVDPSGLQRFTAMMRTAEKQMTQFGKQADALQRKLSRKFGITTTSADRAKLDGAIEKSLQKEMATKQKLARMQHAQNTAALSAQRLVATGKKEEAFLQSASLKQQVTSAILAAKQQKVQQELLKTKLGEHKVQAASEQSQIRQARYADILLKRQAQTVRLQQQAAMHQTKYQRAELALSSARASGVRQAERHKASKLAAAAREARAQMTQDRAAKRFDFSAERHAAWQAKQAQPESTGFGGLAVGFSAASAAVYGLVKGLGYLNERITKRQEVASDNQQFDNTLLAAGNNDAERARIKQAYIDNSQEYGMKIDRESAVAYSNMIQGFRAQGKSLEQAIQLQKDQAAVFRIGNLDKMQQYSAALQLNQGYSKDRFMGQDLRPLTDALGTRLTTILYRAIGKALGYKGDQNKLAGFVLEAQHDGKVNGAMVQQGLRDIVAQSPELLERHKRSLDAQTVRVENDRYLQNESVNKDPELIEALGLRLTAERELIASTKGLSESFRNFDTGLVKMQTGILRLLAGKNADDTDKTPEQRAQDIGSAGFPEGIAIDPSVMGSPAPGDGKKVKDPVDRFYRWLFNQPDYSEGPAKAPMLNWTLTSVAGLKFPPLDMSKFGVAPPDETGQMRQFRMPPVYTAADIMEASEQQRKQTLLPSDWLLPSDPNSGVINKPTGNVDQSMHTDIKVDVTVNALDPNGRELGNAIGDAVSEKVDEKLSQMLRTARAAQTEVE
ncbi:hypothetical protein [Pseudomonas sp. 18058]|uniref:hypothetical protein n=1 Tax=Pseudomonas sp. 18058 TaxID=2681406 RepID=UPI00135CA376|nr:hypothetical protein [Pseudomonas sp. 18058]